MAHDEKGTGFGPRDYTGSGEAGGYPRTGAGSGGRGMPEQAGGSRYGAESEGARQAAYEMGDPRRLRARPGPRGYQRSDARIREDICERLSQDPRIDPGNVTVEVSGGRVVLEGTVPERRMKYVIEDVAAECLRSNEIENRIAVARPGQRSDSASGEASSSGSELGNWAGTSGTTGRPAGVTSPPSGPSRDSGGGRTDVVPSRA